MKSRGIVIIPLLIIVLALAAVGTTAYFVWQASQGNSNTSNGNTNSVVVQNSNVNSNTNQTANANVVVVNSNVNVNANTNATMNTNTSTTGWKMFTNTQFGLTFSYPVDWPEPIVLTSNLFSDGGYPSVETVQWRIEVGPVAQGACEGVDCYTYEIDGFSSGSSTAIANGLTTAPLTTIVSDTTSGSIRTIVYNEGGMCGNRNSFFFGGKYPVNFNSRCGADDPTIAAMFDQILSTIQFTDPTAGWETYTNTEYGFSFKHPSTITITEGTTQFGNNTFHHLTFSDTSKTYEYWMTFRSAIQYNDPLTAFIELHGFSSDLTNTLSTRNNLIIDGQVAKNYCGVPGNRDYCSAFLMQNWHLILFNYYEPGSFPADILSTFQFTN